MFPMPSRKTFRRSMAILAAPVAVAVGACAVSMALVEPPLEEAGVFPAGLVLRDREGGVMRVSLGPGDTDCRPWYAPERSDWLVRAIVASEDKRFFSHGGADFRALARAVAQNVFFGRRISGASTITEQTTRLIQPHPRTMKWKWIELWQAIKMERRRSKDWIVAQYLNRSPFGSNLVGAEAAARGWFAKDPHALSLGEAALLAGIVQAPTRFRPDRHLDLALKRRDYVLSRMEDLGWATPRQLAAARAEIPVVRRDPRPFLHPHYCDWAVRELVPPGVMDFRTPLDPGWQTLLERAVSRRSAELGAEVAAVVVDSPSGEVRAMACSGDYFGGSAGGQVNTAIAPRQAGSTLKPLLFARALARGRVAPTEALPDGDVRYGSFRPANADGSRRGFVRADEALVLSLNLPFFEVVRRLGPGGALSCLREFGLKTVGDNPEEHGLGIAVGNASVRLVDLARAYAAFSRDAADGSTPAGAAARMVSEILSGHERSLAALGHSADAVLPRAAWKTGTSAAHCDAWTVLWGPREVVAVWCGHLAGRFGDRAVSGISAAAPLAWELFRALHPDGSAPWFGPLPDTVETAPVCSRSGLPPSPECATAREAPFIRNVTPRRPCQQCRPPPFR